MASTEMQSNHDDIDTEVNTIQNGKKKAGVMQLLKQREYRRKVMHTMYLGVTFISLGMVVGQVGPTFLDLKSITGTDLEQATAFFTGASIGYLAGSFSAGAMYNKVNKNLLMFSGTFTMGITSSLTAYCKPYPLMIFIRTACGCTAGFLDTVANSEQMRIWGNEGQGLMQFLHFTFALGGLIAPLYTAPFLAKREDTEEAVTASSNATNYTTFGSDGNLTIMGMAGNASNVTSDPMLDSESNVHFAFLITGICAILSGIPFLVFFVLDMTSKKSRKE